MPVPAPASKGLAGGAIAGIALGAGVGLALLLGMLPPKLLCTRGRCPALFWALGCFLCTALDAIVGSRMRYQRFGCSENPHQLHDQRPACRCIEPCHAAWQVPPAQYFQRLAKEVLANAKGFFSQSFALAQAYIYRSALFYCGLAIAVLMHAYYAQL